MKAEDRKVALWVIVGSLVTLGVGVPLMMIVDDADEPRAGLHGAHAE